MAYIHDSLGFPKVHLQMWPDLTWNDKTTPKCLRFFWAMQDSLGDNIVLETSCLPLGLQEHLRNKSFLKSLGLFLSIHQTIPCPGMYSFSELSGHCSLAKDVWVPLTPERPRSSMTQGTKDVIFLEALSCWGCPMWAFYALLGSNNGVLLSCST